MKALFIRDFPDDLHHKAKVQAALERISLKELISKALRDYLRKAGVPEMQSDQGKEG